MLRIPSHLFFCQIAREKRHDKFAGLEAVARREGAAGNGVFKIPGCSHNNVCVKAELALDRFFHALRHTNRIFLLGAEHDVAALHVGLRIAEFQRLADFAEFVHFDFVVATDVNPAQQRNHDRHRLGRAAPEFYRGKSFSPQSPPRNPLREALYVLCGFFPNFRLKAEFSREAYRKDREGKSSAECAQKDRACDWHARSSRGCGSLAVLLAIGFFVVPALAFTFVVIALPVVLPRRRNHSVGMAGSRRGLIVARHRNGLRCAGRTGLNGLDTATNDSRRGARTSCCRCHVAWTLRVRRRSRIFDRSRSRPCGIRGLALGSRRRLRTRPRNVASRRRWLVGWLHSSAQQVPASTHLCFRKTAVGRPGAESAEAARSRDCQLPAIRCELAARVVWAELVS